MVVAAQIGQGELFQSRQVRTLLVRGRAVPVREIEVLGQGGDVVGIPFVLDDDAACQRAARQPATADSGQPRRRGQLLAAGAMPELGCRAWQRCIHDAQCGHLVDLFRIQVPVPRKAPSQGIGLAGIVRRRVAVIGFDAALAAIRVGVVQRQLQERFWRRQVPRVRPQQPRRGHAGTALRQAREDGFLAEGALAAHLQGLVDQGLLF